MTALDDALNSSSITLDGPTLHAVWEELPPTAGQSNDPIPVSNLSTQMAGDFEVEQSLDDGFPDAVTMTNGNDASGSMKASLLGRPQVNADTMGWRASTPNLSGVSALVIDFDHPSDAEDGDQIFFIFSTITGAAWGYPDADWDDGPAWEIVSTVIDGTLRTDIYTRKNAPGLTGGRVTLNPQFVNTSFSWICVAAYARTSNNMRVAYRIGTDVGGPESAVNTTHTAPVATLPSRGYYMGVWATINTSPPGYTWAANSPAFDLAETGNTDRPRLMVSVTPVTDAGTAVITANTSSGTALATMQVIPLMIGDLPAQAADSYFSPFNKLSPIYGFDRDTAAVDLWINVLTADGVVGTPVFNGLMEDIALQGKQVEMTAISKTRIDMDRSLTLPVVNAYREGCTVDWLVSWLMARGGQFAGPAPTPYTRYWAPLYGSTQAHLMPPLGYNSVYEYNADGGPFGLKNPTSVDGPFLTGMFAEQTATRIVQINLMPYELYRQQEKLPFLGDPDDIPIYDQFSQESSLGRLTFWVRGDAAVAASPVLGSAEDVLFRHNLYLQDGTTGEYYGYVYIRIDSSTRHLLVTMGTDAIGGGTVTFSGSLTPLPTDGNWHFYGVAWNFQDGECKVMRDGVASPTNTYWASNGYNYMGGVPQTDADGRATGKVIRNETKSHLPLADLNLESGWGSYLAPWTDYYPTPKYGNNALMRPTRQPLKAVYESTPVGAWGTIAELAQATTSAYRTNEEDNFEFLPQDYFGETAQMTPSMIADTELNAGELKVVNDPSKSRNRVTVQFPETSIDTMPAPVLTVSSAVTLPRGTYDMTFALENPCVEIHGAASPTGPDLDIRTLTASELANPDTIPTNIHYMTPNSNAEGTGWGPPYIGLGISARIVGFTASTVTVRFKNTFSGSGSTIYLANNVEGVAHLNILGYNVRVNDGYVTRSDTGSLSKRRERAMDTELAWIHDRYTADARAAALVSALARPRAQISVIVVGDPRRRPGQLVTLKDAQNTQADGTWRILSVTTKGDGPEYTQELALMFVGPIARWDDETTGWDFGVWGE